MRVQQGRGVKPSPRVIRKGVVVKAPITPDGGASKPRPAVVVKTPAATDDQIVVVGVTTDNERYDPNDAVTYDPELYIPMPYAADGSASTGFTSPCAAKATWVEAFPRSKIQPTNYRLADELVDELVEKLKAYVRAHPEPGA